MSTASMVESAGTGAVVAAVLVSLAAALLTLIVAVLRLAVLPLVLAALLLDAAAAWAGRLLEALPGPWHAIPAPGGA